MVFNQTYFNINSSTMQNAAYRQASPMQEGFQSLQGAEIC